MQDIMTTFPPKIHMNDLVAMIVHMPPENIEEKGILYFVVKQLNYF